MNCDANGYEGSTEGKIIGEERQTGRRSMGASWALVKRCPPDGAKVKRDTEARVQGLYHRPAKVNGAFLQSPRDPDQAILTSRLHDSFCRELFSVHSHTSVQGSELPSQPPHCATLSQLTRTSIMVVAPRRHKGREGAVEVLDLAGNASNIVPAKGAFDFVGMLLTMARVCFLCQFSRHDLPQVHNSVGLDGR